MTKSNMKRIPAPLKPGRLGLLQQVLEKSFNCDCHIPLCNRFFHLFSSYLRQFAINFPHLVKAKASQLFNNLFPSFLIALLPYGKMTVTDLHISIFEWKIFRSRYVILLQRSPYEAPSQVLVGSLRCDYVTSKNLHIYFCRSAKVIRIKQQQ